MGALSASLAMPLGCVRNANLGSFPSNPKDDPSFGTENMTRMQLKIRRPSFDEIETDDDYEIQGQRLYLVLASEPGAVLLPTLTLGHGRRYHVRIDCDAIQTILAHKVLYQSENGRMTMPW